MIILINHSISVYTSKQVGEIQMSCSVSLLIINRITVSDITTRNVGTVYIYIYKVFSVIILD